MNFAGVDTMMNDSCNNAASDDGGLIVDFPSRRRMSSSHSTPPTAPDCSSSPRPASTTKSANSNGGTCFSEANASATITGSPQISQPYSESPVPQLQKHEVQRQSQPRLQPQPQRQQPPQNRPPRSVRFSTTSQMTLVSYATPTQRRTLWYSPDERDELKRELLRDVHLVSLHLARTPMEHVHHSDLVMCIGMETLLSPELSRLVKLRKRRHVKLVLLAQARQASRGVVDTEELCLLSENSSQWTRDRSRALASGYLLLIEA